MKTNLRLVPAVLLSLLATVAPAAPIPAVLQDVHRIVFLGDSITQGGDYVTDVSCWLLAQGIDVDILNMGLGSETATDLTAAENAGHLKAHKFGRPPLSERLDRVLSATKPDLVIACYGMNDGSSLPADEGGDQRFKEAITHLREAALASGARRVLLCTPPVQDSKDSAKPGVHDGSLARYSAWLLGKRADGWDVVDIHGPMRKALDEQRARTPGFAFSKDGVHPGREGHWLMASQILTQQFGAKLDGLASAEALFPAHGKEIRGLLSKRMQTLFAAWMTKTGHTRPGVPGGPGVKPGPSVEAATATAVELTREAVALAGQKRASGAPAMMVPGAASRP